MQRNQPSQTDRAQVSRTAALLLGLADLAEQAACRCLLVRLMVFWALRPAEAVTWAYIARIAPGMPGVRSPHAFRLNDNSAAEALLMAHRFRILSQMIDILSEAGFCEGEIDWDAMWSGAHDRALQCFIVWRGLCGAGESGAGGFITGRFTPAHAALALARAPPDTS